MSLESFRDYCERFKFYYFESREYFDKRIDWNGKSVKNVVFDRGLVDEGVDATPERYSAYGYEEEKCINP